MSFQVFFYMFFFLMSLGFGVGVVLARKPVHSLACLVGVMIGIAGIFLLMGHEVLAAVQILVYAGAIVVLFVFVVMLLNMRRPERPAPGSPPSRPFLAGALALLFFALAAGVVTVVIPLAFDDAPSVERLDVQAYVAGQAAPGDDRDTDPVATLADTLLVDFLLPFELISILLLAAMVAVVGATRATRKEEPGDG